MTAITLTPRDPPLGTIAADAEYNQILAESIESVKAGHSIPHDRFERIERSRLNLWSQIARQMSRGMCD